MFNAPKISGKINRREVLLPWLPGAAAGCSGVAMAAAWVELLENAICPDDGMRGGGGGGGAGGI